MLLRSLRPSSWAFWFPALLLVAPISEARAEYLKGMLAHARGDYADAFRELEEDARTGHVEAQFHLALLYLDGRGAPQDDAQAAEWFREAADSGHPGAQNNLGLMYKHGRGLPQDYRAAARWLRRAAGQGFAPARHNLALAYWRGEGVPQDFVEALRWIDAALAGMTPDDPDRETALENRDAIIASQTAARRR